MWGVADACLVGVMDDNSIFPETCNIPNQVHPGLQDLMAYLTGTTSNPKESQTVALEVHIYKMIRADFEHQPRERLKVGYSDILP